jgi:hypothetical protein
MGFRKLHFQGRITGNGHEASCMVRALHVTDAGSITVPQGQYSVGSVSDRNLPEGVYQVLVNGEAHLVRLADGSWYDASPVTPDDWRTALPSRP